MTSVLIADDDDLMRAGLAAVLSSDTSVDVVGMASTGRQAVERTLRLAPDVVLMDVRMPDLDGIAAARELSRVAPNTHVLVLTTFEQDDYILASLRAGASGFLLKRTPPEQLISAVHTVAEGAALLSPSVTRRLIDHLPRQPTPDETALRRLDDLTRREREVLELVARGLSNAEIATALTVEESTVKTHVKRIFGKLNLRDRVHAVIYAYETGIYQAPGAGP